MADEASTTLPRQERAFIVLVSLLQGLLLYLAWIGHERLWWWLSPYAPQVYWYTLVLAIPTTMSLSVRSLGDPRFWQHALGVAIVYALLASWAAWSVTSAPGIDIASVLAPFAITAGGALFVSWPFLQCRQENGRWRAAYPELFDHAWQNGLTLVVAVLFTGVCWIVLTLWAQLFALVHIHFFKDLFFDDKPFAYLATGLFAGLGILIGRTQQHPLRVARQILFAVCRGLLPLLALIALMFLVSLPFTGLAPLWATRSAARLLLGLLLLLVVFVNAVWQDGVDVKPYPRPLRWLIDAALILSPVYAALTLYALALRIGQYGWTGERFWAVLTAVVLACHALGYMAAALRWKHDWLAWLPRVNVALAGVVIVLAILANSPALDPHRITVDSQIARLHAGRVAPGKLDVVELRFDNGRRGYAAAVALQKDPAMRADPAALAQLEHTVARQTKYEWLTEDQQNRLAVTTVAALHAQIAVAPGAQTPDDDWYEALLARRIEGNGCVLRGADCVLLTPDLRGDGQHENLLCNLPERGFVTCLMSVRNSRGTWTSAATVTLIDRGSGHAVEDALRAGKLGVKWQRWPDVEAGGVRASFVSTCDCDPAAAAPASTPAPPASR
ncbi:MAG: hypothetical protein OJF55_000541 [Rhodanobacteraceae bacterium]|nr:MAG: hypothetical protein OJF55_000541 [Rhodanobacteraceae bacterium]